VVSTARRDARLDVLAAVRCIEHDDAIGLRLILTTGSRADIALQALHLAHVALQHYAGSRGMNYMLDELLQAEHAVK